MYGFLFFIFVWHLCIYAPIAHITWFPTGFFRDNEVIDFSGGIVVNMLSSITVLAAHLFLNWKGAPKGEARAPSDPTKLVLNAVVVWFLWFGINAGKAHAASPIAAQSIVNTIAGTMISILVNFLIDTFMGVEQNDFTMVNAILFGLVATTPSSGYVTVGGSMIISIIVSLSTRIIANGFLGEAHNAPYSIGVMHGLAGTIGFLFTAVLSYNFVNSEGVDGLTYGNQTPVRHHLAALLAMWSACFVAVMICLFLCNLFVTLGRPEQSGKGDYAPTPVGPFKSTSQNIEHNDVYKHESAFSAEPVNGEAPAAETPAADAEAPAETA